MLYKIIGIKHSGTKGERSADRMDGKYPNRIGRIIWMSDSTASFGYRFHLNYIADENGNDFSDKTHQCSNVERVGCRAGGIVEVETQNSIYVLKPVNKVWCE